MGAWVVASFPRQGLVAGLQVAQTNLVWSQQLQPPGSWAPNLYMPNQLLGLHSVYQEMYMKRIFSSLHS